MGMTATYLGKHVFARNARDMNKLLRLHNFLEGEPGAYRLTDLGKQFAKVVDFDKGYGGIAYRQWDFPSWNDGIVNALKASMKANPDGVLPASPAPAAVVTKLSTAASRSVSTRSPGLNKKTVVVGLVVVGAVAAAPAAKDAWDNKVLPTAAKIRSRVAERKAATASDGTPSA